MHWPQLRSVVIAGLIFGSLALLSQNGFAQTLGAPVAVDQPLGYGETPYAPTGPGQPAAQTAALPIDLLTVLRLVDANNPSIALSKARVEEAYQRWQQAQVLWLPTINVGSSYLLHDGHWSVSGHTLAAEEARRVLVKAGLGLEAAR